MMGRKNLKSVSSENRTVSENIKKGSMKQLLKALKPYIPQIICSFICIAISTVLSVLSPQWVSKITDEINDNALTLSIDLEKIAV